jgi:hypothetical protein
MATIQLKRSSKPVQNLMMKSKNGTKYYIKRFYTPSSTRCNWLDQNCGDVPRVPRPQNEVISEMLRGGHAIQLAHSSLLKGIVSI